MPGPSAAEMAEARREFARFLRTPCEVGTEDVDGAFTATASYKGHFTEERTPVEIRAGTESRVEARSYWVHYAPIGTAILPHSLIRRTDTGDIFRVTETDAPRSDGVALTVACVRVR